jgi:hypothetical protein
MSTIVECTPIMSNIHLHISPPRNTTIEVRKQVSLQYKSEEKCTTIFMKWVPINFKSQIP